MSVFCVNCGTENKQEFNFCKSCGAKLLKLEEEAIIPVVNVESQEDENIFGVSRQQLKLYIGKNSTKILSRFEGMEKADSKVSFCVPSAVLGLFFGFFGLSFWFFYRKMNKQGWISVLIGTLFYIAVCIFTYPYIENSFELLLGILTQGFIDAENSQLLVESVMAKLSNLSFGVNYAAIFSDIEKTSAAIIGGLYGLYFYKKNVVKSITEINETCDDAEKANLCIKESGGTSGGRVVLAVLLKAGISVVVSIILTLVLLFSI